MDSLFLAANIIRGSSASTFPDLFGRGEALEPRIYEGSLGLEVGSLDALFWILDALFCILYNVWGCPCGV